MNDKNAKKLYVLLSDSELNDIANALYAELTKLPLYDKNRRIKEIKYSLCHVQNGIIKNINNLNDEESKIVPELITFDKL